MLREETSSSLRSAHQVGLHRRRRHARTSSTSIDAMSRSQPSGELLTQAPQSCPAGNRSRRAPATRRLRRLLGSSGAWCQAAWNSRRSSRRRVACSGSATLAQRMRRHGGEHASVVIEQPKVAHDGVVVLTRDLPVAPHSSGTAFEHGDLLDRRRHEAGARRRLRLAPAATGMRRRAARDGARARCRTAGADSAGVSLASTSRLLARSSADAAEARTVLQSKRGQTRIERRPRPVRRRVASAHRPMSIAAGRDRRLADRRASAWRVHPACWRATCRGT